MKHFIALLTLTVVCTSSFAHASDSANMDNKLVAGENFARNQLVAWCIVPFDAKNRGPAERAAMVKELGMTRVAYDWRQKHKSEFEQEIIEYKKNGLEYFAFWNWDPSMAPLVKKHNITPQVWNMFRGQPSGSEEEKLTQVVEQFAPSVKEVKELGLKFGIYNHGGWAGEPKNLVAACKQLREKHGLDNVGIVYNFHHAHNELADFKANFEMLKPYLLCVNLNGMAAPETVDAKTKENKILPIGSGIHEKEMLKAIIDSGYDGPIGVLGHRADMDAKVAVQLNLDGLESLVSVKPNAGSSNKDHVLLEAESFTSHGGWKLDTQFIDNMGSPYLLAHGLGKPVADATTKIKFPQTGEYKVFVRTKDWVAQWKAPGQPGKFQVMVNDKPVEETFGTKGADWFWHDGGTVRIDKLEATISIHDLTGFDGRCDAIFFTKSGTAPPNDSETLAQWRLDALGLSKEPTEKKGYDLVVVGGGYSGLGSALSAARMGCKVALIQNRPVLGGNGSSEVRVWSMGHIRRGKYPRVGEIVEEFCDHATKSPGTYQEFEDAKKEKIVRAEDNIDLFLNHHAYKVEMEGNKIAGVHAFDTRTSEHKKFVGRLYVDCTGHGTIGFLAGANWEMTPKGRMGMSNMWAWDEGEEGTTFPKTPWALDLDMKDFPYPRDHHGQWFWEGGFDKDPINGAESIRDWNLRAVFGAFNAMKNRDGAEKHKTAFLTWIAYIGGPRESRRLMGDVVLTGDDVVAKKQFKDGCVPSTWSIDLHYPKKQYAQKFPDNPFISIAEHDRRIDRSFGYPVPYRCFYSRNIDNLFMAGRCISVTHKALGTTRVMKTCGMMGEVVGRAASICVQKECSPRDVYEKYWEQMDELLKLPGMARRENVNAEIVVPPEALELAGPNGIPIGTVSKWLPGVVVDNTNAVKEGKWTNGSNLKGYIDYGYLYAGNNSGANIRFNALAPKTGKYEVRIAYQPHKNRGKAVPVFIEGGGQTQKILVDMTKPPTSDKGFHSIGFVELTKGQPCKIRIETDNAGGTVHADAVQLINPEMQAEYEAERKAKQEFKKQQKLEAEKRQAELKAKKQAAGK